MTALSSRLSFNNHLSFEKFRSFVLLYFFVMLTMQPPLLVDESIVAENEYVITDPLFRFPTPKIVWMNPESLIPHEHTSKPHLEKLISYLQYLPTTTLLPVPVVTKSFPHVILDGHHRVAASCAMGITRIPVWIVDIGDDVPTFTQQDSNTFDQDLKFEENRTSIRCYSRIDDSRIRIKDVVKSARSGTIGYGIKGTKHVAVVSRQGKEVKLERVTPRLMWGVWASSGRLNASEILAL